MLVDDINDEKSSAQLKLAMLAHDIRSPLTAVLSSLTLLSKKLKSNDETLYANEYKEIFDISMQEMYHTIRLTNNAIDADKMQRGLFKIEMNYGNISKEISSAAKLMMPLISEKEINLVLNITDDVYAIFNTEMIIRAICNLVSNSIKAVEPQNGIIEIVLSQDDNNVYISVSDNGKGIAKKDIDNVFDAYWHTETIKNNNVLNAGLGLYIVKETINSHGGTIKAICENGKTEFSVILPKLSDSLRNKDNSLRSIASKYESNNIEMVILTEMCDVI